MQVQCLSLELIFHVLVHLGLPIPELKQTQKAQIKPCAWVSLKGEFSNAMFPPGEFDSMNLGKCLVDRGFGFGIYGKGDGVV